MKHTIQPTKKIGEILIEMDNNKTRIFYIVNSRGEAKRKVKVEVL